MPLQIRHKDWSQNPHSLRELREIRELRECVLYCYCQLPRPGKATCIQVGIPHPFSRSLASTEGAVLAVSAFALVILPLVVLPLIVVPLVVVPLVVVPLIVPFVIVVIVAIVGGDMVGVRGLSEVRSVVGLGVRLGLLLLSLCLSGSHLCLSGSRRPLLLLLQVGNGQ
ncbi:hypothetical protein B484DRAFT_446282 [Ochromonadaceae sp. CCMP2298]|nr:hypothetical protein B484DRAFT_446282 [Ochromonadaceae sp. CCMP2298]